MDPIPAAHTGLEVPLGIEFKTSRSTRDPNLVDLCGGLCWIKGQLISTQYDGILESYGMLCALDDSTIIWIITDHVPETRKLPRRFCDAKIYVFRHDPSNQILQQGQAILDGEALKHLPHQLKTTRGRYTLVACGFPGHDGRTELNPELAKKCFHKLDAKVRDRVPLSYPELKF